MVTLFQAIIFIAYISFLLIKFKRVLPSISESWYELSKINRLYGSIFTWFCVSLGVLMFFHNNGSSPFFFISGAGLNLCGVAAMFKDDKVISRNHFIGAFLGIVGAFLGLWVEQGVWIPLILWIIFTILFYYLNIKNKTWWIEIAAFVLIILGFLL